MDFVEENEGVNWNYWCPNVCLLLRDFYGDVYDVCFPQTCNMTLYQSQLVIASFQVSWPKAEKKKLLHQPKEKAESWGDNMTLLFQTYIEKLLSDILLLSVSREKFFGNRALITTVYLDPLSLPASLLGRWYWLADEALQVFVLP